MTWWTTTVNSVWHWSDDGHTSACGQPVPDTADTAADVAPAFTFRPWTEADGDGWQVEVDGSRFVRDDARTPHGKRQCHHCWMARRKANA